MNQPEQVASEKELTVSKKTPVISKKDLDLINSKKGIKYMLFEKEVDHRKVIDRIKYENRVRELQVELIKLQAWVVKRNKRVMIIVEGRDFAGKGGAIKKFAEHLNPRNMRSVALPKPTPIQKRQWYFKRYVEEFPLPGEIVFYDRSWYNRAMVEPVNKFCSKNKYKKFMNEVNQFEEMIMNDGIELIKFYFSITKSELEFRLKKIKSDPLKNWKISSVDKNAIDKWDEYTSYKDKMMEVTNRNNSPWVIIDANNMQKAHISAMEHVLSQIIYK